MLLADRNDVDHATAAISQGIGYSELRSLVDPMQWLTAGSRCLPFELAHLIADDLGPVRRSTHDGNFSAELLVPFPLNCRKIGYDPQSI